MKAAQCMTYVVPRGLNVGPLEIGLAPEIIISNTVSLNSGSVHRTIPLYINDLEMKKALDNAPTDRLYYISSRD